MGEATCKECNGQIITDRKEAYCSRCALVVEDTPIDLGKEHSFMDPEKADQLRRTGPVISWLNPEWSTTFDPRWKGKKQRFMRFR